MRVEGVCPLLVGAVVGKSGACAPEEVVCVYPGCYVDCPGAGGEVVGLSDVAADCGVGG